MSDWMLSHAFGIRGYEIVRQEKFDRQCLSFSLRATPQVLRWPGRKRGPTGPASNSDFRVLIATDPACRGAVGRDLYKPSARSCRACRSLTLPVGMTGGN